MLRTVLWGLWLALASACGQPQAACDGSARQAGCECLNGTCAAGLVCAAGNICELEPGESGDEVGSAGTTGTTTSTDTGASQTCSGEGAFRCAPVGLAIERCDMGLWSPIDCTVSCDDGLVGACIDDSGTASCACAEGLGGSCSGDTITCAGPDLLQFCQSEQEFQNSCSRVCNTSGYSTEGPCTDWAGDGTPGCVCADNEAGSCPVSEEGASTCSTANNLTICASGTLYEIYCPDECDRQGLSGVTCSAGECQCV